MHESSRKPQLTVRSLNDWILNVAGEAGCWVEGELGYGYVLIVNDQRRISGDTLAELIDRVDQSGLLGAGLWEDLAASFSF